MTNVDPRGSATGEIVHPQPGTNVAEQLRIVAMERPEQIAIVRPGADPHNLGRQDWISFAELNYDVDCIARGLRELGISSQTRIVLLVRPSSDFIALVLALLRSGGVMVLIDPGMGLTNLLACLDAIRPDGFIAMPRVQAARTLLWGRYPNAKINVTVGPSWFCAGTTLGDVRKLGERGQAGLPATKPYDPAAIIFTSGSTGPPKGVLYHHAIFTAQVAQLRELYGISAGQIDLPGFPLFGLFNCAMGVTTVLPEMDPSHPARVRADKIVAAIHAWKVTQSFGSPAMWNRIGRYCQTRQLRLPSLKRIFSAGAPVPAHVLRRMKAAIHPEGKFYTPYGATEALPVSSIEATEVLGETQEATDQGAGVCVGRRLGSLDWKVISITNAPIASLQEVAELPQGHVGELIVRGPAVTTQYTTSTEATRWAKISDGTNFWHRMGDLGYLDAKERFWFCGRMTHRVTTRQGLMFPLCCEALFNVHPAVNRSALVGVGPPGKELPVLVVEPTPGTMPRRAASRKQLTTSLRQLASQSSQTQNIEHFLFHHSLPVDVRHNAKILRDELAHWATSQLKFKLRSVPDDPV